MKTLLLILIASLSASAQNFGAFVQVGSETFYKYNLAAAGGLRYKEFRLGAYYQSAHYMETKVIRKGLMAEAGLFNVDKIVYFSGGLRAVTTNKRFVEVIPHFSTAFRFNKHVEVPIILSFYNSQLTGGVSLRVLL